MPRRHHGACLSLSLAFLWGGAAAASETTFDLALVLAVDVSSSMAPAEQSLQRLGFIEAFRSPAVHKAIARGALGRIAVAYVEWSGADEQTVLVPWTVIDGPDAARTFASELKRQPIQQAGMTSISGVIGFSMRLFADLADRPTRRVIDISGDGPNNDGPKVGFMRDHAVAEGITINGLPIQIPGMVSAWEFGDLDRALLGLAVASTLVRQGEAPRKVPARLKVRKSSWAPVAWTIRSARRRSRTTRRF
ncbi:DUF1194 domain-containing protein [Microvirga sp. CF3016]|uniref:DUF1194 domain-containing protein n=1 Tax=Microvirga sp. CF3016 TaxID=3110181 RepID=UPI002E7841F9|nr:DUF1194 domain-containing protein [Microvirga sp. CF3016]MEE1612892.1 DUF1194 domain-containing protein [Microvirga sp. CF3016]